MLTKAGIKQVHAAVDKLFTHLKYLYLGHKLNVDELRGIDKRIAIGHRHELSLPGLYESAAKDEGFEPNDETLDMLQSIAAGYLDAECERTKAKVVKDVSSFLKQAKTSGVDTDLRTVLGGSLAQTFDTVTADVNRIIDSEAQNGRAIGTLEGIEKINAQSGVDDPTVFFVIVRDNDVCKECLKLHQLSGTKDGPPRVWKLSELGHGYHKCGDPAPKVGGLHPHCRCSIATLLPGYGFDAAGMVTYVDPEHDEYAAQQGEVEKSELDSFRWYDDLSKADGVDSDAMTTTKTRQKKVKAPEPPALVAVHNLSEENLHHAHDVGGLVAPSVAIAHRDYPFSSFGEVTLVAHHQLVDPQVTPVFDADIYSPRYPRVKTEIKRTKTAMAALHNAVTPYFSHFQYGMRYTTHTVLDHVEEHGVEAAIDHHQISPALKAAYLKEKHGVDVQPVMEPVPIRHKWAAHPIFRDFLLQNGVQRDARPGDEYFAKASEAARKAIRAYVVEHPDHKDIDDEFANDLISAEEQAVFDEDTGQLGYGAFDRAIDSAQNATKMRGDDTRTRLAVESAFNAIHPDKTADYRAWARALFQPALGQKYIPKHVDTHKGPVERKIPYTLENVLKEMTRGVRQGEGGMASKGLGGVRASGARRFRSFEQIRQARHQLATKEAFEEQKKAMEERFDGLCSELRDAHPEHWSGRFGMHEALGEVIADSYKRGRWLHKELRESGFTNVSPDLHRRIAEFARDLVKMPTEYFEAKPQRVVHLNEFRGAVVPHDVSDQTLEVLRQHGIDHIERYELHNAADRWDAVRRVAQAKSLMLAEGSWS